MTLSASLQRCRGQGFAHNDRAETLLTVTFALPALLVVRDAAVLIKEEIPFFLVAF